MKQKSWKNRKEFKEKVKFFADKIGVEVNVLHLRPMRKKWASCSTNGNLHFNDELLDLEKALGEYVMVHELLHFRAHNHGRLWKSYMLAYIGDYKKVEDKLRKAASTNVKGL